ncbi:TIGR01777 family oxidoreductase [Parapedobacter pyrenivorans]|uniref:TIGR01777 family oxidoreductase n=1 Tax=Parapedobacter pyrenivorans TaxID=1305674 RepID=UPI00333FF7A0
MKGKIVIAGGRGSLGSLIVARYLNTETEIVILTRKARLGHANVRYVVWDATTLGRWAKELEGATAVINLVGKSVNCRYTAKNKAEIIRSRVDSTAIIGAAIQRADAPPKVWINAGSAAIFGDAGDEVKMEGSLMGNGFSPEVCRRWEAAFHQYDTPDTRKIFLRIGIVIQSEGGILKPFFNLARFGLGGKIGSGEQYLSWIHETDFANLVDWVIGHEGIQGTIHATSPHPVKNKDFMQAIRQAVGIRLGLPNYTWSTKFGAWLIGTEAELLLSGRRVVSKTLAEEGFQFDFPEITDAFRNLAL